MAAKKPPTKKVAATKESGVVYISSTGSYFTAPEITVDQIVDLHSNVYARGLADKQNNLIFTDKYYLEVRDADGNQDEDLELDMTKMCDAPNVKLWAAMQIGDNEGFWYGCGLFNPVWEYVDNIYTLTKLRHLPSNSFGSAPMVGLTDVYSKLLEGITLNENNEVEYWQTQDDTGTPVKVDNVFMVKDPISTELAGTSTIVPVVPIISMLKYTWDSQMKQVNRTGTKILFIKVTDPQGPSTLNGNVGDIEAAKEILKYWGSNTAFPLRGNMEIIDPQIKDDSNSLEIIEALNQMLIDYVSPIDVMTAGNDSARLGGSDSQRLELILRYIKSRHSAIEESFQVLLQTYLDVNGYEGYTVTIHIPAPEIDTSEIDIKRADMGLKAKALKPNEIRELIGQEPLDETELAELEEYYTRVQPEMPAFQFTANSAVPGPPDDLPPNVDPGNVEDTIEEIESIGSKLSKGLISALKHEEPSKSTSQTPTIHTEDIINNDAQTVSKLLTDLKSRDLADALHAKKEKLIDSMLGELNAS